MVSARFDISGGGQTILQCLMPPSKFRRLHYRTGVVAQLGERSVRNAEVEGSNPFNSTVTQRLKSTSYRVGRTLPVSPQIGLRAL